ncbi:unnamed protein product [Pleuronectes platessa]|uniref:Uncharacterized protein n=1 Tax=Pleuronectes platessa TaxID=8262 RepID=A0A9N7TKF4_PLEPL|nr:unnamed protein product [Pleuronectes platessa]
MDNNRLCRDKKALQKQISDLERKRWSSDNQDTDLEEIDLYNEIEMNSEKTQHEPVIVVVMMLASSLRIGHGHHETEELIMEGREKMTSAPERVFGHSEITRLLLLCPASYISSLEGIFSAGSEPRSHFGPDPFY